VSASEQSRTVAIVINWRDTARTLRCLESLSKCLSLSTIIIVDNESDGSLILPRTLGEGKVQVELIRESTNLGFAAAFNRALRSPYAAPADFILAINNDATIDDSSLRRLEAELRNNDTLAAVGPRVTDPSGRMEGTGGRLAPILGKTRICGLDETPDYISWACILLRSSVADALQGLDERYFMYWEDVDYGIRAKQLGFTMKIAGTAHAVHDRSPNKAAYPKLIKMYHTWSLVVFSRNQGSAWRLGAAIWIIGTVLKSLVLLRGQTLVGAIRGIILGLNAPAIGHEALRGESLPATPARYYRAIRTAHIERLKDQRPAALYYRKQMYDFDTEIALSNSELRQTSTLPLLWNIWRGRFSILETVEPLALSALPENLLIAFVTRMTRLLRNRKIVLVTYAIENADLVKEVSRTLRLPQSIVRVLLRGLLRQCLRAYSRIAFGTEDARGNYLNLAGSRWFFRRTALETTLLWGLPGKSAYMSATTPTDRTILFVGALDSRKGVSQLLGAWDLVAAEVDNVKLTIIGKGTLETAVSEFAESRAEVRFFLDPPRDKVWECLDVATCLVLLSQPAPRWKEQIGLPIIEGLSFGLEIVCSTETGIAQWLRRHGHRVVPPDVSTADLVEVLVDVCRNPRDRGEIITDLPEIDGRVAADRWLFRDLGACA
jgi:GT2 family glycosyltransferase